MCLQFLNIISPYAISCLSGPKQSAERKQHLLVTCYKVRRRGYSFQHAHLNSLANATKHGSQATAVSRHFRGVFTETLLELHGKLKQNKVQLLASALELAETTRSDAAVHAAEAAAVHRDD